MTRCTGPHVPVPDVTIADYVLRHAARLGDKPALIDGPTGRVLTYRDLSGDVGRAAVDLARRGFGRGDVLAIYSPNVLEYATIYLAVASLGGVITTINPLYTADELASQLRDSGACVLVTVPDVLDKAKAAASKSGIGKIDVLPFDASLAGGDRPPTVRIDPRNDLVALPYSSGTTGLPKGVMLTHRNLVANLCQVEAMEDFEGFGERDRVMVALPLFHIYGILMVMMALAGGGTAVIMPRFDLQEFLRLVQTYRATVLPLVPPIILAMVRHLAVAHLDLPSLRLVLSAAAPLGEEIARALSTKLGCPVVQTYGMTEAAGATTISPTRNAPIKPVSVGRVVPNTEVKVVGVGTDVELRAGEAGELWIRGPQIMKGYLNRPDETASCLDREGWYHTGDVGYVDEDGYFFVVDRTKELIKYKGLQVAPAELEALLLTHPAVHDAAVVRTPDEEAGEVPKAYVVLKPDTGPHTSTAESITTWVAERVAPHKRIRALEFIEQIPKSASGKILRRMLMDTDNT
jgi:acyl-CoA synthetase (AMP-forming)/AMP-acid ligase II